MGFNDDFPLNPPPLPADWSVPADRNQHDSLQEVRGAMREFADLVAGLRRMKTTTPDGRVLEILAMDTGAFESAGPWDLAAEGAGLYSLANPILRWRIGSDVDERITVTGDPFEPTAGYYVVLVIDNLIPTEATYQMLNTWGDFPSSYEFDGSNVFQAARLPIWKFHATQDADETRREIASGVFAEKLIQPGAQRLYFPLVLVPTTTHYRTVPDLL